VSGPLVSVVLPTRNGLATLPALLDAIGTQDYESPAEIVAIDCGSTDGTVELLRQRTDQLIEISAEAFNHGLTRNLGIERARGELVVLIVQDALPLANDWLANLTAPFADRTIAGTFARQTAREDAGAITRHYAQQAVATSAQARLVAVDRVALAALPPMARLEACTFDNVCSLVACRKLDLSLLC